MSQETGPPSDLNLSVSGETQKRREKMHIEPGIVNEAKMVLSYATAAGSVGLIFKHTIETLRKSNIVAFAVRSVLAVIATFIFFEILPKFSVGVSEVHFIFGSTLFLLFGAAPAALGLAAGLALQGLLFAPADLPQYFMNTTTLLLPLFALSWVAKQIIPENTAYVDLSYSHVLKLSATYQAGIIAWVAFWAFYGQGFGAENITSVASFGVAYLSVILIEPVVDVAVLAMAKAKRDFSSGIAFNRRLTQAA